MQPEQQQRILGYFIEEAKDHLNTIEQGLVDLQNTLNDPEMVNEVFRAAHSVKGGAAMLGLNSIQRTSHRLEDYFKIIKECPKLKVDQNLETLFLQVFDNLKELLEQLESPAGLTEDVTNNLMLQVEPVFEALNQHLNVLVNQAGSHVHPELTSVNNQVHQSYKSAETASFLAEFEAEVMQKLRQMLELFKQSETPASRQQLQQSCQQLVQLGEKFNLPGWRSLCETASGAIANVENTYHTLATIIIKNIKQAQELVVVGRESEITTSEQLQLLSISTFLFGWEDISTNTNNVEHKVDFKNDYSLWDDDSDSQTLESNSAADSLQESLALNDLFSEDEQADFGDLFEISEQPAQADVSISNEKTDLFSELEVQATVSSNNLELSDQEALTNLLGEEFDLSFEQAIEDSEDIPELEALGEDEIAELEALLAPGLSKNADKPQPSLDPFATYSQPLIDLNTPGLFPNLQAAGSRSLNKNPADVNAAKNELDELEQLLEEGDTQNAEAQKADNDNATNITPTEPVAAPSARRVAFEQMMRVPVKQLDNISNLVGELVVYRNTLEQDQGRLRQFVDNLLRQVQFLSDMGSKMQELYERSLLEASLISSRQGFGFNAANIVASNQSHSTGMAFDALEMDRFTGFHTLSQEIIELIVRVREASSDIEFVTEETDQLSRQFHQVTTHLQEGLTRSRMVSFSQIADRLPRAVRDISIKYGKQAELYVEGGDTLIDKGILEQLYDPMTHLVNNAITHGIETPDQRAANHKPAQGKITIRAFHQGNQTVISVADDGCGIDPEKVKAKAIQKKLITSEAARKMPQIDVYNLLFHAGFSTKDSVDEFAGRGVGMDVVLTSLTQIRGTITIDSTLGKGTTFTIRLPLTLSICKALCCVSDKARIAFPMDGVEQTIDIPTNKILTSDEGHPCISWNNSLLTLRPLNELLSYNRQLSRGNVYGGNREEDMVYVVILRSAGTYLALEVDQVIGEQEIVIKQFEGPIPKPVGVAGATVMGDGRITPIADVMELIDLATGRLRQGGSGTLWYQRPASIQPDISSKNEPTVLIIDDSITVRELLSMTFKNAGYRVEQARDGQEAWEKLRDGLPCDIVFCDIEMPRMDGLELLSRIQKDADLSQIPIAMLTSRGSDRHRKMAVQLGASGYFTKPYLEEALLDGAQRMLRGEVLLNTNSLV